MATTTEAVLEATLYDRFPWKTQDSRLGFKATLYRRNFDSVEDSMFHANDPLFHHPKHVISGGRFMFHNTDELPFKSSQVYFVPYWNVSTFFVTPVVTRIDDSLIGFTPEEYKTFKVYQLFVIVINISDETVILTVKNVWNSLKLTRKTTANTNVCPTIRCHNAVASSFG